MDKETVALEQLPVEECPTTQPSEDIIVQVLNDLTAEGLVEGTEAEQKQEVV